MQCSFRTYNPVLFSNFIFPFSWLTHVIKKPIYFVTWTLESSQSNCNIFFILIKTNWYHGSFRTYNPILFSFPFPEWHKYYEETHILWHVDFLDRPMQFLPSFDEFMDIPNIAYFGNYKTQNLYLSTWIMLLMCVMWNFNILNSTFSFYPWVVTDSATVYMWSNVMDAHQVGFGGFKKLGTMSCPSYCFLCVGGQVPFSLTSLMNSREFSSLY